jgi:hypothetical protein
MSYRCAVLTLALLAGLINHARAADLTPINGGGVTGLDLKSQLEKGLYARRPVEFEYIEQIIQLVEDGELPRDLVTSTFVWARKKPNRRLQYFQFALQSRTGYRLARPAAASRGHQQQRRPAWRQQPLDGRQVRRPARGE